MGRESERGMRASALAPNGRRWRRRQTFRLRSSLPVLLSWPSLSSSSPSSSPKKTDAGRETSFALERSSSTSVEQSLSFEQSTSASAAAAALVNCLWSALMTVWAEAGECVADEQRAKLTDVRQCCLSLTLSLSLLCLRRVRRRTLLLLTGC